MVSHLLLGAVELGERETGAKDAVRLLEGLEG